MAAGGPKALKARKVRPGTDALPTDESYELSRWVWERGNAFFVISKSREILGLFSSIRIPPVRHRHFCWLVLTWICV